ncbi:MAG TPA: phospholipase D-like domain-containing protein [Candidatus Wallbacteria bacterium]|nr:phospholipase D-like domain-containing protein [Candidatus Wallbacteria bacterium]
MPVNSYAAKTDRIKIIFNDPPDTKNIDIELANFIDSASKSVIAHFYQINRQCVIDAFVRAAKRLGPKNVKVITESKYYNNKKFVPFYAQLEAAGISILTDESDGSKGSGESHNKFCVVDSARVWTGSYNATDNNTVKDHNNALILDSTDAAAVYAEEFSMMYDRLLFGSRKESTRAKHKFSIDSVEVEIYFSPADNVNGIIENYIRNANAAVSFVIFAFTEDNIEDALISRHKAGINVRGICDDLSAGGKSSGYYTLLSNNMNIKKDSNPRAQLHHKFTVIDHESGTSAVVITGSHNYTKAANTKNDENIVIIHDKYYAQLYFNEFAKLYGAPMVKIDEQAPAVKQILKQDSTAEVQLNRSGNLQSSDKTTENLIKK